MLQERNLIYFDPFYFPDGGSAKSKYFVILQVDADDIILGALPTRKDTVPADFDHLTSGCIQMDEPGNKWTCFRISPTENILENGELPFYKTTHIYAWNINDYQINYFDLYSVNDYEIVGVIKQDVFEQLISCFTGSPAIKQKYKKRLSARELTIAPSPKAAEEEE